MKIAVSATGGSMNAQVAQNFGRCEYFLIVDSESMKFDPISNPGLSVMGGAGPMAAKLLNDKGSNVVLTGVVGPRAEDALKEYGIEIINNASGTVMEAVTSYLQK